VSLRGGTVVRRTDQPDDKLKSPLGGNSEMPFVNVMAREGALDSIRDAGFELEFRRRWFGPLWRPVE
jgi:hypothetical protein